MRAFLIWKKLQGWKEKLLSKAGKEILINAVAQSIPTYAMSCFRLPASFCDDVDRIIRNFWWGTSSSARGIPWKAWKDLCRPKCEGGLGFRDLKLFNSSLLAKQLWRLHCYPNSLLARSLKSRYYPSSSIWESTVGFNPSYAWRSIWSSRSTLDLGVRWRVGDGKSLKMWKDAWVGGNGSGKLITPVRILDEHTTVDALLDDVNHTWRTDVISEVLFPIDLERIRQIPISTSGSPDMRVWAANEDGVFRVRVAYSLALKAQSEASSSAGFDDIWKAVWRLNIQPKAKKFLWRAIWDILPHGLNLRRKGIESVGNCSRCGGLETNMHVLRDCDWSRRVWLKIMSPADVPHQGSFRDWLGLLIDQRTQKEVEMFGVCAWQIWCARNDLCFEKINITPEHCHKRASDMLVEFQKANCSLSRDSVRRENVRWCPPDAGFVKVNVDASVNSKEDRIGVGMAVRNYNDGEVLLSGSMTIWPYISVERAELEAFQWALKIIKQHQWRNIIVEGDAQNVVKALNGSIVRGYHNQVLVENIHNEASGGIQQISFNFFFREANNVAHRLAKWASANVCSNVWNDGGPSWIMDIVFSDLAN